MSDLQDRFFYMEKKLLDGAEVIDKAMKMMNISEDSKEYLQYLDTKLSYQKFLNDFVRAEINMLKGKTR